MQYHVRVVPVAGAGCWLQHVLVCEEPVHDGKHAIPRVLDVAVVAPQVANRGQEGVVHLEKSVGVKRENK